MIDSFEQGLIIAKTDINNNEIGLPLWMHLRDTVGVAERLFDEWVSQSVVNATKLGREELRRVFVFLAGVHDIGKISSYFQSIITKAHPEQREELNSTGFVIWDNYIAAGETPHAWAGQWILQSKEVGFCISESIAAVVGAHHGRPLEGGINKDLVACYPVNFYGDSKVSKEIWIDTWKCTVNYALDWAGIDSIESLPELCYEAQILLSGLLIVADWLASNTAFFPLIPFEDFGSVDEYVERYPDRIEFGWRRIRFPERWVSEIYRMNAQMFEERFGFLPSSIQRDVLDVVNNADKPGIYILEAPMGSGKTEAALSASEVIARRLECGGVFWGLPTQATSNGLFGRLYSWAACVSEDTENSIRLAHGAASFNDEYMGHFFDGSASVNEDEEKEKLTVHPWFQGNKRALLADFVVGTVDQFLMASLKRKHFMLRHLGLAGKVVIIDECHAYDTYMSQYLKQSIQWMASYGISVILLSATLPSDTRKELISAYVRAHTKYYLQNAEVKEKALGWDVSEKYPLLTWTNGGEINQKSLRVNGSLKQVDIEWIYSEESVLSTIDEQLSEGGCACVILNTVKKAQRIYHIIKNQLKDYKVILYHSQFTIEDRNIKEHNLMECMGKKSSPEKRNKIILVGTQVLEQSLDYDADMMITQLCPMDLLLQRIGRVHRHDRNGRPERLEYPKCYIFGEDDSYYDQGTKAIYGDYLLKRTIAALKNRILLPNEISPLVQEVYRIGSDADFCDKDFEEYKNVIDGKKEHAKQFLLSRQSLHGKSIKNCISNLDTTDEKYADSGVRDTASTIEVILMKKMQNGVATFINPTRYGVYVKTNETPTAEMGKMIIQSKVHLPLVFSFQLRKVIDELESRNITELSEWQKCPWLQGELVLLLDENNKTELVGYNMTYSFEEGLLCERRGSD